jgi:hypothetical protein
MSREGPGHFVRGNREQLGRMPWQNLTRLEETHRFGSRSSVSLRFESQLVAIKNESPTIEIEGLPKLKANRYSLKNYIRSRLEGYAEYPDTHRCG